MIRSSTAADGQQSEIECLSPALPMGSSQPLPLASESETSAPFAVHAPQTQADAAPPWSFVMRTEPHCSKRNSLGSILHGLHTSSSRGRGTRVTRGALPSGRYRSLQIFKLWGKATGPATKYLSWYVPFLPFPARSAYILEQIPHVGPRDNAPA